MKFSGARNFPTFSKLRNIVRSNTSLLQVHKTKLIKLYWSHLFNILIVRQFLVNQPSRKRIWTVPIRNLFCKPSLMKRHYKLSKIEKTGMNGTIFFFCEVLCLFLKLVPSASFCYKRKASKMGGRYNKDFKNPNFPTL